MADLTGVALNAAGAYLGIPGLGAGLGGGGPATPAHNDSTASSATYGTPGGGTGWVINFGSGSNSSQASADMPTTPQAADPNSVINPFAATPEAGTTALWVGGVLALAAVYRIARRR